MRRWVHYGPELNIGGFGGFGRPNTLPSNSIEKHYDIYDNLTKIAGNHSFKFGGSVLLHRLDTTNETFFGGSFTFGAAIPVANLLGANAAAQAANPLNRFVLTAPGSPYRDANNNGIADVFEAPMTALQSFNLNLPIVYQQGFLAPGTGSRIKQPTNRYAVYAQDAWKARQNLTLNYGLRYSISDEPLGVPTYKKDFQPRAGFSWDPWKDGKTVIRGGAGIFVGFLNAAIPNVTTQLGATTDPRTIYSVLTTATSGALGLPSSFAVYQTLLQRGIIGTRPITLADVSAAPLNLRVGPNLPLELRFRLGPNYRNPTTYQASFGVQRDLGAGISLELTYLYARGLHLSRNRDINQIRRSGPVSPLNPLGGPTFATADFQNPLRFQDNIYEQTANSFYHGFTAQSQRRFSNNFSLNAHYTLAKSIDEVVDFNSSWSAQNPLDLRQDRSLSSFDQRHRLVISGVFQSSFNNPALKDWVLAPIFVAQSGRPFNLLLGFDANADRRSQSDRPGLAGRYTGVGEAFYSFDLRLGRRFFVKESRFLELTIEGFNLFNRSNLLAVNNVLGAACTTSDRASFIPCTAAGAVNLTDYRLKGRRGLRTTDPLGFTSAFDPRQLQFGARFNF